MYRFNFLRTFYLFNINNTKANEWLRRKLRCVRKHKKVYMPTIKMSLSVYFLLMLTKRSKINIFICAYIPIFICWYLVTFERTIRLCSIRIRSVHSEFEYICAYVYRYRNAFIHILIGIGRGRRNIKIKIKKKSHTL